eukprot:15481048-Alexandrium_andersonii.AAC.1
MAAAGFSQGNSRLCRFCDEAPEMARRIFCKCPAWKHAREAAERLLPVGWWGLPPCTTWLRHRVVAAGRGGRLRAARQ